MGSNTAKPYLTTTLYINRQPLPFLFGVFDKVQHSFFHFNLLKLLLLLIMIAQKLLVNYHGILVTDENPKILQERFSRIDYENTPKNRSLYQQHLIAGCHDDISGVILSNETLFQITTDKVSFIKFIRSKGKLIGIKMDRGIIPLNGTIEEYVTQGLDGFSERCSIYKSTGVSFAKWHCIFKIRKYAPSCLAITENCNILARYASVCQQNGILPIIMVEVASDGDHDLMTAQKVLEMILNSLYKNFHDHHIFLEGTILSTNMVIAGLSCNQKFTFDDIANATVTALLRTVPPAVAGIAFLSGSMNEADAIFTLNNICKMFTNKPWHVTFCFGYVIQKIFLRTWKGEHENLKIAQKLLTDRIKDIAKAVKGEYICEEVD